ncbi:MAG: glycosyltransferase family 39 protein [Patescibacteria group bacterium]
MTKFLKEWKYVLIFSPIIILIFFILRLYNLTLLPIFVDEAIYVRWAQVMKAEETLRFLPLSDGKQPLFMWSVIPFFKIFSDPLFAGRFVSVFTGLGTLFGVFVLTYIIFKSKTASLFSSLFYAISPFSVFFDRMALVDSMLTMFGIWTIIFGIAIAKTKRLDFAMLAGFSLGGALLTKSPALFFTIMLPSTLVFADFSVEWRKRLFLVLQLTALLIVSYIIGYGLYNILRLGPNFHLISSRNQDYVFPLSHLWTNPRDPFVFYFDRSFEWIRMMGPNLILLIAGSAILLNLKNRFKEMLLLVFWFLFPIAIQSEFAKVITARYILFSLPYLFVIASSIFLVKNKKLLVFGGALLFIFVFQALKFNYYLLTDPEKANLPRSERSGYLEEWTAGTGIKEAADIIRVEAVKNLSKEIVAGTEGYFGTLPDGLQIYLQGVPNVVVIGVGLNLSEVPSQLQDSVKAGNKTYLVINSSRFKIKEPESEGLKLIAAYPKAFRPDKQTHEYLWYGPRDYLYLFEVTGK